jgi:hypothetical protein
MDKGRKNKFPGKQKRDKRICDDGCLCRPTYMSIGMVSSVFVFIIININFLGEEIHGRLTSESG